MEGMTAHNLAVPLLNVGVIVAFVGPGPGQEQVPLAGPLDQGMVDEVTAVIGVQAPRVGR
jgi:hypothetical protein